MPSLKTGVCFLMFFGGGSGKAAQILAASTEAWDWLGVHVAGGHWFDASLAESGYGLW